MRRAFTLVELLAVIAIIALLLALLMPALQRSRAQARATACASNVKELSIVLSAYDSDNGSFPCALDYTPVKRPPGGYSGDARYDARGWWWFNFAEGIYKKPRDRQTVIVCPARDIRGESWMKNDILCGNYGVNLSVCKKYMGMPAEAEFVGKSISAADIPHPARTVLILDSGYSIISWRHATDTPQAPISSLPIEDTAYIPGLKANNGRSFWPGQEVDAITGRHPNKTVNVAYVDGHSARIKADELLVETVNGTTRNRVPMWSPK